MRREIEFLAVERLNFDPLNPRLPKTLDGSSEEALLDWLLDDATIIELMGSIGSQGYFPGEPLIVVESEDEAGEYTVIEGNRRLAAVMLLLHPGRAPSRRKAVAAASEEATEKPDRLPSLIADNRTEVLNYLGYRHITGIKEWDPLPKAQYLKHLWSAHEFTDVTEGFRELARIIGSRSDYVGRLLTSLAIYEEIESNDFFSISGLRETSIDFSVLSTALSYANLANFLGLESAADRDLASLEEKNLEELTRWMFEKRSDGSTILGESRNLKDLAAVVDSKPALAALRAGESLAEAALVTDRPAEIFRGELRKARERLRTAQVHVHLVERPEPSDEDALEDVRKMAEAMLTVLRASAAKAQDRQD